MNWYKKSQLNKEADGLLQALIGGIGITAIATMLGWTAPNVEKAIQENPKELLQQIQQVQESQQPQQEQTYEQYMFTTNIKKHFKDEYEIILNAAKRNNLDPQDYDLLFAIRKAENGKKGRELGILHPKCEEEMKRRPNDTLDIQAGWAAATIRKNRERWEQEGSQEDFITYLGNRYCPTKGGLSAKESELNKYWIPNVKHWVNIL